MPSERRCAAIESPYGPAPTMATFVTYEPPQYRTSPMTARRMIGDPIPQGKLRARCATAYDLAKGPVLSSTWRQLSAEHPTTLHVAAPHESLCVSTAANRTRPKDPVKNISRSVIV